MERPAATQSLLVPLDGSPLADHAVPYAAAIAAPGARFVLFRVLPAGGAVDDLLGRYARERGGAGDALAAARAGLEASAALLPEAQRGAVELATATGNPTDAILDAIAGRDIGAVVIASHGRGAVGRWMFGSVADRIARASPVPVVIVRPEAPDAPPGPVALSRLLVPLDGSETAMEALPVAASLARDHGWPLHLLTAVEVASMTPLAMPGPGVMPLSGEVYEQVYDEARAGAQRILDEAADRLRAGGLAATTEVRVGGPVAAISDALRAGDLIVLASHGRTGVRRWLLGSVAEQLVRFAPAPVMLVPVAARAAIAANADG